MIDNLFCLLSLDKAEGVLEILFAALIIVNVLIIHEVEDRFHVRNYHKTFRSACNGTLFECQTRYRWRYVMTHRSRKTVQSGFVFHKSCIISFMVQERSVYI